ncbi:MAG: prolyl aminopeptidase [Gammaproteobacteria bacterium]|nr:prolyl aminopeptidase [Gammaproteobacteria bacterium]MDH3856875.1 prolyl aminopeptidase [Gammaproteobacteria bacterium]
MLFPAIQPTKTWRFPVTDLHTLYIEESGNPNGVPVIFLHGGPGGSCEPGHRRFFNPEAYRIILFDQRGSGKSRPHASLEDNTTWDLVADLEKIRKFLEIDRWVVFGGSWGSTLALAYAQTHPEPVLGLILRGIFLGRDEDIDWFFNGRAARIFPEAWEHFIEPIPPQERDDIITAYYQRLTSNNEIVRMGAAKAWSIWEGSSVTLLPDKNVIDHFSDPHIALSIARIECHYFCNNCFLRPGQLIEDMDRISHIPGYIVHGRYDMVCPIDQALLLKQNWEEARLKIINDAGHAVTEHGISNALVDSCNAMLEILG